MSASVFLLAAASAYYSLQGRVENVERAQKDQREMILTGEQRLLSRMSEDRARFDSDRASTTYEIRNLTQIVRDGFKELDSKLDRKADKPGR